MGSRCDYTWILVLPWFSRGGRGVFAVRTPVRLEGSWVHLDSNQGAFLIARYEFIWTVGTQPILAVHPYASTAIVVATRECLSFFLVQVHARSAENSVPGP